MVNTMLRTLRLSSFFIKSPKIFNYENIIKISAPSSILTQHRNSSFRSSNPVREPNEYPDVEVFHNPPEWKYVERLLAPSIVPKPKTKPQYPSGWQPPQKFDESKSPYFIARTKNFMLPIYLCTTHRGQRRTSIIRRIQGDIWKLEEELRALVETHRGKICASRINEMSGQIRFHGDYVNLIKDYLQKKGF